MKKSRLEILLIITMALWLMPWIGKSLWPALFDLNYLQWSLAVLSSLLLSCGALLSLLRLLDGNRKSYWLLIAFTMPILISLVSYGVVQPILLRLQISRIALLSRDGEMIAKLSNQLLATKPQDKEQSLRKASLLYSFYGIRGCLPTDDGKFVLYYPTPSDKKEWLETQRIKKIGRKRENLLNWQLIQMPWLFALYLVNYFLITAVGLGIYIYKKTDNPAEEKSREQSPEPEINAGQPSRPEQRLAVYSSPRPHHNQ